MKLLITGGAGFIGSNLILYWRKKYPDDLIINLDKLTYAGNLENLKGIERDANYKFVKGDICDRKLVDNLVKDVDVIIHLAAESHVDRSILDPAPFITTNVLGTYTLLESATNHKISRFIHISTDEVFGSLSLDSPEKFNEKTPYTPSSPYAASKASADHLVRSYYTTYKLPVVIINCSNNFGPFQFPEKLIPLAITNAIENKKVPIYGDGKHARDWLYVTDHCWAIEKVLKKGRIGETYLVGGTTTDISNLEVVKKILSILGKPENLINFVKERPGHDRKYSIDWSKIKNELGWTPKHDFDTWLEETVKWYIKNKQWWKKVKSGEYKEYYKRQYGGINKIQS